ncbi:hypothetical protein GCM10022206_94100 [Streptomyces chiangmaiensis]
MLPFELVDAVLEETRAVQQRLRDLPSRAGVYFQVAMCLFPEVGYRLVWDKMTSAVGGALPKPSTNALRDLRRRVGCAPIKTLFEVVAGVLAQPRTPRVCFGPYRTVSFDGCRSIKVPDRERNQDRLGRCSRGGYPQTELMTLVETGTRALIGAVFGPCREGETSSATRLLHHLGPGCWCCWTGDSTATTSSPPRTPPAPRSSAASAGAAAHRPLSVSRTAPTSARNHSLDQPGRRPHRDLRFHRGLVQRAPTAQQPRLLQPRRVRDPTRSLTTTPKMSAKAEQAQ